MQKDNNATPVLIIITGMLASGKSSLAHFLSNYLHIPVFSKDDFKETLFDNLGYKDRATSRTYGKAASQLLYFVAKRLLTQKHSVIIESNFPPTLASKELKMLARDTQSTIIQIVCYGSGKVLQQRFADRANTELRHAGHCDAINLHEFTEVFNNDKPQNYKLDLDGIVIEVNTTCIIDNETWLTVARNIRKHLLTN